MVANRIMPNQSRTEAKHAMREEKVLSGRSMVNDFAWEDVLIPDNVGKGQAKWWCQRRTLIQYACMAAVGLYSFETTESSSLRAGSLGLLFPGAGLIAVSTIPSIISFIITLLLVPVVMFAWFGLGGVAFPILLWSGSSALAAAMARESVLEIAGPIWAGFCIAVIALITYKTSAANAEARKKRDKHNDYLVQSVKETHEGGKSSNPGSRELDLKTLRFLQWFVELGLTEMDDFSYHDIIDQFQTSALRYQLYEAVSDLGFFQYHYAPNFHGYVSKAMRNCIEKSLTQRVVGFWKWESLWGKFTTRWDPIIKDDIMVSGYILQAVGIYQTSSGDDRYNKPGSLTFQVDKTHVYPYDFRSIADAVNRNWEESPYCLYSCEPSWIYTPCNLVGINGMVLAEKLLGVDYATKLKPRFEAALEEEFTNQDGTILPIRNEMTGFTLPGLAGAMSDAINAMLCSAYLPHIAHRNWAFSKNETLRQKDAKIDLINLVGADKLDPGNYKPGVGALRAFFAAPAAEFGDQDICTELLRQLDEEYHPVVTTYTGALKNKGLSTLWQGVALRARMARFQDWVGMVKGDLPENVRKGPLLVDAPFPDVLVAKAYSHDGESLELVLYPGNEAGIFALNFSRLRAGETYDLAGKSATAGKEGDATFVVAIDGRTAMNLVLKTLN